MSEINCEYLQDIISDHGLCYIQKEEIEKVINHLTTTDVIRTPYFYGEIISCPNCGNNHLTNLFNDKPNYCLNCGKKLKW